jgi:hypothetical protein
LQRSDEYETDELCSPCASIVVAKDKKVAGSEAEAWPSPKMINVT